MDIDALRLQLRQRAAWETVDLGCAIVLTWAKPVYKAMLLIWLPFAILLLITLSQLIGEANLQIALGIIWWLKPIAERLVLATLAEAIFTHPPSLASLIKRLPALLFKSGLLNDLLWGRLTLTRCVTLPVKQLERPTGKARRIRLRQILAETKLISVGMGIALLHAQLFFYFGSLMLLAWLSPIESSYEWMKIALWNHHQSWITLLIASIFVLVDSLFLPFYTASGFALYLQRRTNLEAWDLQHKLQQIGDRLHQSTRLLTAWVIPCLVILFCYQPYTTQAATSEPEEIRWQTTQILQGAEFGKYTKEKKLHWVSNNSDDYPSDEEASPSTSRKSLGDTGETIGDKLAEILRVVFWILGAGFISWLSIRLFRQWQHNRSPAIPYQGPSMVFGMDVNPENLPADIPSVALSLIQTGQQRQAMSLLYRGALVYWLRNGLEILPGDTEGDCVQRVKRLADNQQHAYFQSIVAGWQRIAYGHQQLDEEQLITLARSWSRHFASQVQA